jgi:hypothetical protein
MGELINIINNNKNLLDLHGNIIMIPVKFIVDVDMNRTLHDKVD